MNEFFNYIYSFRFVSNLLDIFVIILLVNILINNLRNKKKAYEEIEQLEQLIKQCIEQYKDFGSKIDEALDSIDRRNHFL